MIKKDEMKYKSEIIEKLLPIFTGAYKEAFAKKVINTFEQGLINPDFAEYKRFYSKWPKEKTQLLIDTIRFIESQGYTPGEKADTREVSNLAASFIDGSINKPTPPQIKEFKVKGPITAGTKNTIITKLSTNVKQYLSRCSSNEAMLGFGNLTAREDASANLLSQAAQQYTRAEVMNLIAGEAKFTDKQTNLWQAYLPDMPKTLLGAFQVATASPFWLGSILNLPEVEEAIKTKTLLLPFAAVKAEAATIKHEEQLIAQWEKQRPQIFAFANAATTDYIRFNYRGIKETEALRGVWVSRMAGFRMLDAHITGVQQLEEQQTSGIPITYRKLQFELGELPDHLKAEMERISFIKLGKVISAEYGLKKENQRILERAIFECKHPVNDPDRKFNYDHFVGQYSKHITPILFLTPLKVKQKGMGSIEFIHQLYNLAITTPDIPKDVLQQSPLLASDLPVDLQAVIPQDALSQIRVSPQQLSFLGLYTYLHQNQQTALALVKENLPEFVQAIEANKDELKKNLVHEQILAPVLARDLQREVCHAFKAVDGHAAQLITQLQEKYKAHPTADILARAELFEAALKCLSDSKGKNQENALKFLSEQYQVSEKARKITVVTTPEAVNWNNHAKGETVGGIPVGWVILEEHMKDMQKDGLTPRTIKMAGVRSVVDESERTKVLTRNGKSEAHAGMMKNGVLLIYPNPLISEAHSKTENPKKKYVAPDGSCNPPMVIPVQAQVLDSNIDYLSKKHDNIVEQKKALERLRDHEQKTDLSNYTNVFLARGFEPIRAKELAEKLYSASTAAKLYNAMSDNSASIEITEGQKKAYKMYQSYKELIESEDQEFIESLSPAMADSEILKKISEKPQRGNKLFVCSPGVWLPVKSWEKFKPEEKAEVCEHFNVKDEFGKNSPINPNTKYCLIPSWLKTIPMADRAITITYDADAKDNPNVAQSVSAMAQAIQDAFPNTKVAYRLIVPRNGIERKGADDYLVEFGNKPFYDELQVKEVAPNIGFKELAHEGPKAGSIIEYLIKKQAEFAKQPSQDLTLIS